MADRCVRAWISGKVQGVGFRWATQRAAASVGAHGYVRNLPDQRVEAVFEGDETVVAQALDFVRQGPPDAQVTEVEEEQLPLAGYPDFEILH